MRQVLPVRLSGKLLRTAALAAALAQAACGYTLRSSESPLFKEQGVTRLYIAPVKNDTYKAGVENLVYNALLREMNTHLNVRIVRRPELSDAGLFATVHRAEYSVASPVRASELEPKGEGPSDVLVASYYSAVLGCSFRLKKTGGPSLWSGGLRASKQFPASNRLGVLGTTSALINDSEFDRALQDLAKQITTDLRESMLAGF